MTIIQKLRSLLTRRDKKILLLIVFATICISFIEVANISLTMLFIATITNFKNIQNTKYVEYINKYIGNFSSQKIILMLGVSLIFFYLFRCIVTFLYAYKIQKFVENRRNIITFRFFQNYLNFNYHKFTDKNPASIGKLIFTDATNLMAVISSLLIIFAEFFTISLIYLSLIIVNWKMTLVLTILLFAKITFILKIFSQKLSSQGKKLGQHICNINKIFYESFRNFKLIKLFNHETYILSRFDKEDKGQVRANVLNKVLQETPRLFLETIGFTILVATVIYVVYRASTPEYIIPTLSMYALAFYRFMPSSTKIMNSYNQMTFAKGTIDLSNDLMYKTKKYGNKSVSFGKTITLEKISFNYKDGKNIISDLSLKINKKERVAFIGESGVGKSTLTDIIMGFHSPKEGKIYIDDKKLNVENIKSWQKKIGYVPQQIYLFDGTVAENVAFGRIYDEEKIIESLKKANVFDFIMKKNGLKTMVGEGGIKLSGGQMQRIAVARALYSNPEILILDEATSSLDNETEETIMSEIYDFNKDKTLIVIAHRLSTVLRCEKIYKIENQKLNLVNRDELYLKQIKNRGIKYANKLS